MIWKASLFFTSNRCFNRRSTSLERPVKEQSIIQISIGPGNARLPFSANTFACRSTMKCPVLHQSHNMMTLEADKRYTAFCGSALCTLPWLWHGCLYGVVTYRCFFTYAGGLKVCMQMLAEKFVKGNKKVQQETARQVLPENPESNAKDRTSLMWVTGKITFKVLSPIRAVNSSSEASSPISVKSSSYGWKFTACTSLIYWKA